MVDRHHPGKAPTALLQRLSDGACLTVNQLAEDLDLTNRQVADAAACLHRRGYLERMAIGCYQLTEVGIVAGQAGETITSGPKGPHAGARSVRNTLRERAWRAMRIRKRFTVADLVADAGTAKDANPTGNLQRYLQFLRAAGYVKDLPRRSSGTALTSNGFKRWMLIRDTGPRAPSVRSKKHAIHDFNTGEDVPCVKS